MTDNINKNLDPEELALDQLENVSGGTGYDNDNGLDIKVKSGNQNPKLRKLKRCSCGVVNDYYSANCVSCGAKL